MEDKILTLELSLAEVNDIMKVLGELPSKSGAWPLMQKIAGQANEQLPQGEAQE